MRTVVDMAVGSSELAKVWSDALPNQLKPSDESIVKEDGRDPHSLRIHIRSAEHDNYSFDFLVTYVDSREIQVQLIDVERGHVSIDERNDAVQSRIETYVRAIHECAQALKGVTHQQAFGEGGGAT